MSIRPVKRVTQSRPTMEGAGVRLRRAFGFGDTSDFDPFLMMDDFRGDRPTRPRYQDVPASAIPEVIDDDGARVRVICGDFWGKAGPVDGVAAEPRYLDVTVPAGKRKRLKVEDFRQAFAYIFEGSADFSDASAPFGVLREAQVNGEEILLRDRVGNRSLVVFGAGDEISVQ